jgi:lipoprotein-anchoring transpeptidase ErfK/SrfK
MITVAVLGLAAVAVPGAFLLAVPGSEAGAAARATTRPSARVTRTSLPRRPQALVTTTAAAASTAPPLLPLLPAPADPAASAAVPAAPAVAPPSSAAITASAPGTGPAAGELHEVATSRAAAIEVFGAPDSAERTHLLRSTVDAAGPLALLVIGRSGDRLQVLLPVRPNGATGWVRAGDVTLSAHPWRIVVELSAFRLTLLRSGAPVATYPIGVGKGNTPTPGGRYYTKELLAPPNPAGAYGPYAYGLSGFSPVLTSFAGGTGVIGIHGTNRPELIGQNVSSGCIRMRNEDVTVLAKLLPLGVPVDIVA